MDAVIQTAAVAALLLAAGVAVWALLRRRGEPRSGPLARRDVIEHLSDGVLLADAEGVVTDANPAAEELLGAPRLELIGGSLESAMARLCRGGAARVLARRLARMPQSRGRMVAELETGSGRIVEVNAGFAGPAGSRLEGRFVLLRDRTDHTRFERLVRQRQKHESVGILAAGVAHEVNNPLAFVRSNVAQLGRIAHLLERRAEGFDEDERRELADFADVVAETSSGLDRIAAIVAGLLSFSRIPREAAAPIDVNEVARAAIRYAGLHESADLDLSLDLAPDLPPVRATHDRLAQVLRNLLLSAKRALAGRGDGVLTVVTRRSGDAVEIGVEDNGPGLAEHEQEKLFDPFYGPGNPDRVAGLGLSSAFDIVRDLGGTLEVASRPGEGSRFTVRLPTAG